MASRLVTLGGSEIQLTRVEFTLFESLYRAKGRVLTIGLLSELIEDVTAHEVEIATTRVHVHKVRRKMKRFGVKIENIYSTGYRMQPMKLEIIQELDKEGLDALQ